jgi:hypothetical protein
MEVSCQLHVPAILLSGKEFTVGGGINPTTDLDAVEKRNTLALS